MIPGLLLSFPKYLISKLLFYPEFFQSAQENKVHTPTIYYFPILFIIGPLHSENTLFIIYNYVCSHQQILYTIKTSQVIVLILLFPQLSILSPTLCLRPSISHLHSDILNISFLWLIPWHLFPVLNKAIYIDIDIDGERERDLVLSEPQFL